MRACIVMVVRDELPLIEVNVSWHLNLGFEGIMILDHRSCDGTTEALYRLARDPRVKVFREERLPFDHEVYANRVLSEALDSWAPEWIFPLDADEFLCTDGPVGCFLDSMESSGIRYASIKWLNALPTHRGEPLDTIMFYEPWPERSWQHEGHFRKSFCRAHSSIEIVVGGHYFRWERNPDFFRPTGNAPVPLPLESARIYHFERRGSPSELAAKWRHLSESLVEPGYSPEAPWNERLDRIKMLAGQYGNDIESIEQDWFCNARTFWGAEIPEERIRIDTTLRNWRRKRLESHAAPTERESA